MRGLTFFLIFAVACMFLAYAAPASAEWFAWDQQPAVNATAYPADNAIAAAGSCSTCRTCDSCYGPYDVTEKPAQKQPEKVKPVAATGSPTAAYTNRGAFPRLKAFFANRPIRRLLFRRCR